jgi:HSP20 family protein
MTLIKVAKPRLPSLVDDMFRSYFDEPVHSTRDTWRPAMDAFETDTGYEISFSMPGFKKEQIHVSLNNKTLTIRGEHGEEQERKGEYLYREIAYGTFERSLYLPENVDAEKVNANYTEGILNISIAKLKEAMPREIDVKVK